MNRPTIETGYLYPIKAAKGAELTKGDEMVITENGPLYDREFMVIGPDDVMRTQRDAGFEKLALVQPALDIRKQLMTVWAEGFDELEVPLIGNEGELVMTHVHRDPTNGLVIPALSEWMSDFLKQDVRAVQNVGNRVIGSPEAPSGSKAGYADAFHLLGISQATLAELNGHLEEPVGMNRFRPNLVFGGTVSRQENDWRRIAVSDVELAGVKPCERCPVTNVRQETGERTKGQVLRALAQKGFRGSNRKPLFGENFIVTKPGVIRIGDEIEILESSENGFSREY